MNRIDRSILQARAAGLINRLAAAADAPSRACPEVLLSTLAQLATDLEDWRAQHGLEAVYPT